MGWLALTLRVEPTAAEAFSDALLEAGAQSVSLEGRFGTRHRFRRLSQPSR